MIDRVVDRYGLADLLQIFRACQRVVHLRQRADLVFQVMAFYIYDVNRFFCAFLLRVRHFYELVHHLFFLLHAVFPQNIILHQQDKRAAQKAVGWKEYPPDAGQSIFFGI